MAKRIHPLLFHFCILNNRSQEIILFLVKSTESVERENEQKNKKKKLEDGLHAIDELFGGYVLTVSIRERNPGMPSLLSAVVLTNTLGRVNSSLD